MTNDKTRMGDSIGVELNGEVHGSAEALNKPTGDVKGPHEDVWDLENGGLKVSDKVIDKTNKAYEVAEERVTAGNGTHKITMLTGYAPADEYSESFQGSPIWSEVAVPNVKGPGPEWVD